AAVQASLLPPRQRYARPPATPLRRRGCPPKFRVCSSLLTRSVLLPWNSQIITRHNNRAGKGYLYCLQDFKLGKPTGPTRMRAIAIPNKPRSSLLTLRFPVVTDIGIVRGNPSLIGWIVKLVRSIDQQRRIRAQLLVAMSNTRRNPDLQRLKN